MKYYITFGDFQYLTQAGNPYQACIKTLQRRLDRYVDSVNLNFRVSKVGFEEHEEDEIILLEEVVKILELSNKKEI